LELQSALENPSKLILVLDQVVEDVAKKSIEDDKSCIDLSLVLTLDELEEKVEQVLPYAIVLFVDHSTLDLNSDIANFMHVDFVGGIS